MSAEFAPHAGFVAAFDRALRGGALPPGVTARCPDEAARRFDVYRNNVAVSLSDALAARFPVIRRLVGDAFFAALARLYAETHRPASPVLADWGGSFADFLAGFPPLAGHPYMADVARIEWARGRAYHAADGRPIPVALLAGADPAQLRLRLHASVAVLRLAHPAVSIWAVNQPGAADAAIPSGPEIALILRDPDFEVPVTALGAGDAALVEGLRAQRTLGDAALCAQQAEPGHDPQPILLRLMRAGAILAPETP